MEQKEVVEFCKNWLLAWTGNKPEKLIGFYSENAYYQDPANPMGLYGHKEIYPYFKKLLKNNPDWIWEAQQIYTTPEGFVLKWKATIPIGTDVLKEYGMDIVEVKNKKIIRNEVYFDRTKMTDMISKIRLKNVNNY